MNKIILQPAADKDSAIHFQDTVINFIRIDHVRKSLSQEQNAQLEAIYPSGRFRVWGVTKGDGMTKVNSWKKINRGDIVLFAKNKTIYASATVTHTFQNATLAKALWGHNANNETWEYLYFLDELVDQTIPYAELNVVIPRTGTNKLEFYKPNKNIQGFQVLNEYQSQFVFDAFDFASENYFPELDRGNKDAIKERLRQRETTDKPSVVKTREEQGDLKAYLFGGNATGKCGICHNEYPVSFLVAAHIKKRSACSHEDRINPDIVMPLCKTGCDELYERGFISVKEGKVVGVNKTPTTMQIEKLKASVIGNDCKHFNELTRLYFEWHNHAHRVK